MTRVTVTRILIVYFAIVFTAAFIRVDRFPLTWVPMYTTYTPRPDITVRGVDHERMARGLFVTRVTGRPATCRKTISILRNGISGGSTTNGCSAWARPSTARAT